MIEWFSGGEARTTHHHGMAVVVVHTIAGNEAVEDLGTLVEVNDERQLAQNLQDGLELGVAQAGVFGVQLTRPKLIFLCLCVQLVGEEECGW